MKRLNALIAFTCLCSAAWPAMAQTNGSSGATAASVQLSVASVVKASASVAPVQGTAPANYDATGGASAVSNDWVLAPGITSVHELLGIGAATTEAYSSGATLSSVTGTTTLTNVSSTLETVLAFLPTIGLGIGASTITSTTTAGVDGSGALYSTGSSSLAGLNLTGNILSGLSLSLGAWANASPNTVAVSLAGLQLTLNEQLVSSSANSIFAQTNAVHLALNNYSFGGSLISGDVILGHSQAQISAVPEPAAWATMLIGFSLLGVLLRRDGRHRSIAGSPIG